MLYPCMQARSLWITINQAEKPIMHDEAETRTLHEHQTQFLRTAVDNFGRCVPNAKALPCSVPICRPGDTRYFISCRSQVADGMQSKCAPQRLCLQCKKGTMMHAGVWWWETHMTWTRYSDLCSCGCLSANVMPRSSGMSICSTFAISFMDLFHASKS